MELSIILISHNQSWNIPRLIESVLHETTFVQEREILLVDSASSDGTAELAATFPIRVLRLPASQRLTAAAGRYVGCKHTTGKLVLFLDGDMEMMPGWLACAMDYLARNPAVAAMIVFVTGSGDVRCGAAATTEAAASGTERAFWRAARRRSRRDMGLLSSEATSVGRAILGDGSRPAATRTASPINALVIERVTPSSAMSIDSKTPTYPGTGA